MPIAWISSEWLKHHDELAATIGTALSLCFEDGMKLRPMKWLRSKMKWSKAWMEGKRALEARLQQKYLVEYEPQKQFMYHTKIAGGGSSTQVYNM